MTGPAPGAGVHRKKVVIAEQDEKIELEAEIIEALRNRMFRLRMDNGT